MSKSETQESSELEPMGLTLKNGLGTPWLQVAPFDPLRPEGQVCPILLSGQV